MSYEQRPMADAKGPGSTLSWSAGYPAAPSAGQLGYGWQSPPGPPPWGYPPPGTGARRPPSAASRTRMLFQLRHSQVTALRPAAALPVCVHDRQNVLTLVDERQPAALPAWSAIQEIYVSRAGRHCGTQ